MDHNDALATAYTNGQEAQAADKAVTDLDDRISTFRTIIENGGSFGLTYAQKRILLESLLAVAQEWALVKKLKKLNEL